MSLVTIKMYVHSCLTNSVHVILSTQPKVPGSNLSLFICKCVCVCVYIYIYILNNFSHAEQQYLMYLHYCKGRFMVGVGVDVNKKQSNK